tara:strand:- start:2227 stop:2562 length:336 start_codon:yes stop_codon:yes gene_type:complete
MAISRRKKLLRESKLKMYSSALKRAKRFSSSIVIQEFKEYVPCRSPLQLVNASKIYPSYECFTTNPNATAKAETKKYSGDYVTGLATMHKSNIVPVGKNDDPANYATMRRN